MSEQQNQISKLAGVLTEYQRHFGAMSVDDRQWVIQNTVAAIGLFATAVKNRTLQVAAKLLQFLSTFQTSPVEEFIAREKFVEGKTVDGVTIAWLGDNFKKNFLGKIEKDVPATELKVHKLLQGATDLPKEGKPGIIPELGGKHETALAHFFQLLAHKERTKDSAWTVGYIADEHGIVWAVRARWDGVGWCVHAFPVERPRGWSVGHQFLSR